MNDLGLACESELLEPLGLPSPANILFEYTSAVCNLKHYVCVLPTAV